MYQNFLEGGDMIRVANSDCNEYPPRTLSLKPLPRCKVGASPAPETGEGSLKHVFKSVDQEQTGDGKPWVAVTSRLFCPSRAAPVAHSLVSSLRR